jgi:hypothetical protein
MAVWIEPQKTLMAAVIPIREGVRCRRAIAGDQFTSVGVAGPSPTISSVVSSSFAPS